MGGNGEPFIDKDIFYRLKRIRELNKNLFVDVYTNGLLLNTPEFIESAINVINMFRFSINAFSKTNYESTMIGGNFDKLIDNVQLFMQVKNAAGNDTKTSAEFIVMKKNIMDIVKGIKFCSKYGIDSIVFKPLWIIDDVTDAEFVKPEDAEANTLREQIGKALQLGRQNNIIFEIYKEINELYFDNINFDEQCVTSMAPPVSPSINDSSNEELVRPANDYDKFPCSDPWDNIQIFEDGGVLLCCQGVTPIGNLNETSISDIWNGNEANRYRVGMINGKYYGGCKNCNRINPKNITSYEKPMWANIGEDS